MPQPPVKAFLVDPHAHAVQEIALDPASYFEQIRQQIQAQWLDGLQAYDLFGGQHAAVVYIDDEGLFKPEDAQAFSYVNELVIAGRFVVLCQRRVPPVDADDDGWRLVDPDFSADAVREKVVFCTARFAAAARAMGVEAAAAAYVARGLQVTREGDVLIVTPPKGSSLT